MLSSIIELIESIGCADLLANRKGQILAQLEQYGLLLNKWNRSINLMSREGPDWTHHVCDSLNFLQAAPRTGRILDIGSGAGFPGIPLKILLPDIHLIMIESQRKRASFLATVIRDLKLSPSEALHGRAEDLSSTPALAGTFDAVLFRSVAEIGQCLHLADPFLKSGGVLIAKQDPAIFLSKSINGWLLEREIEISSLEGVLSKLMVLKKVPRGT